MLYSIAWTIQRWRWRLFYSSSNSSYYSSSSTPYRRCFNRGFLDKLCPRTNFIIITTAPCRRRPTNGSFLWCFLWYFRCCSCFFVVSNRPSSSHLAIFTTDATRSSILNNCNCFFGGWSTIDIEVVFNKHSFVYLRRLRLRLTFSSKIDAALNRIKVFNPLRSVGYRLSCAYFQAVLVEVIVKNVVVSVCWRFLLYHGIRRIDVDN